MNVKITKKELEAFNAIVDYSWYDEEKHLQEELLSSGELTEEEEDVLFDLDPEDLLILAQKRGQSDHIWCKLMILQLFIYKIK